MKHFTGEPSRCVLTIAALALAVGSGCSSGDNTGGANRGDAGASGTDGGSPPPSADSGTPPIGMSDSGGTGSDTGGVGKDSGTGRDSAAGNDSGIVPGVDGGTLCTNPVFMSSDPQGKWPASGNPYVNNNVWNTAEAGPQTIYVCGLGSFYIVSNQPDLPNDRGSVKSYPSVCKCDLSNTKPISAYTDVSGTFAESIPQLGEWDVGYDIFLGSGTEVMIQNATHNHGEDVPYPAGSIPVTIDGVAYHALQVNSGFIVLLNDTYIYSGSVNILHVFNWLGSQGWVSLSDTFSMIGYGVEISVTETAPGVQGQERFDFTDWSLNAN